MVVLSAPNWAFYQLQHLWYLDQPKHTNVNKISKLLFSRNASVSSFGTNVGRISRLSICDQRFFIAAKVIKARQIFNFSHINRIEKKGWGWQVEQGFNKLIWPTSLGTHHLIVVKKKIYMNIYLTEACVAWHNSGISSVQIEFCKAILTNKLQISWSLIFAFYECGIFYYNNLMWPKDNFLVLISAKTHTNSYKSIFTKWLD